MKCLILAGGYGSRLSEETDVRPKPMVEVGGKPILWHIMKIYSHFGFNEFIILCGYKGFMIKKYFADYFLHQADVTFDLNKNEMSVHHNPSEPWKVTLLDTGLDTMTGGRILGAKPYIEDGEKFMLTYGDGVGNINILKVLDFHKSHPGCITMTSSHPEGRFGSLDVMEGGKVSNFVEKPINKRGWINAGYFVCDYAVFDYIQGGDTTIFERSPLEKMAQDGQLYTYKHEEFWHPMDTLRDKKRLDQLWKDNQAPWKMWSND